MVDAWIYIQFLLIPSKLWKSILIWQDVQLKINHEGITALQSNAQIQISKVTASIEIKWSIKYSNGHLISVKN